MSPQADYIVANGTGAAVRSDINGQLAAIASNNSGVTEPATMYAYQWWPDTTTGLLKIRNAANSAWVTVGTLASTNLGLLPVAGGTMTGVLAVTAGTAALPGIAVSGDLNTGLFSPGADTVALVTGGTNRVHVTSGGLVGIGTNNPAFVVDVSATNDAIVCSRTNGNTSAGFIGSTNNGTNNWFFGSRKDATGGTSGTDRFNLLYDANNYITVTTAGNVGIGTTSPAFVVDVSATNDAIVRSRANGNTSAGFIGSTNNGTNNWFIGSRKDSTGGSSGTDRYNLLYDTNAFLTVTTAGNVGIGTTSPANQLQLSTDSAGKPSTSTWTIVSDERIKEDIELADLDLCYEAIKAIPLKRYKWRDEIYTAEQVTDRRKLGWIAQDVETVFPKAVGTHEFKYNQVFEETIIPAVEEELDAGGNVITPAQPERTEQGDLISEDVIEDCRNLNSDQIYAAMYGAVQKLMAKVEALEASNADLLARVAALKAA